MTALLDALLPCVAGPLRQDVPSALLRAFPKSGSTLLNNVFRELAPAAGMRFVDIPGACFHAGIAMRAQWSRLNTVFRETGCCFGGFRWISDSTPIPQEERYRIVLLVRDPRDMLVSHYFSLRHSHPPPGRGSALAAQFAALQRMAARLDCSTYALRLASAYRRQFRQYAPYLEKENVLVVRYEDMLFRKADWFGRMIAHLGWTLPAAFLHSTIARYDIIPEVEDPHQHIRKATPGDHKEKLPPATIARLNALFADELRRFNYLA